MIVRAKEWKRQRPLCMARFKSIYTLKCGARISPEMQNLLSSKQRELTVTGWYSKLLNTSSLMKHTQLVLPPCTELVQDSISGQGRPMLLVTATT